MVTSRANQEMICGFRHRIFQLEEISKAGKSEESLLTLKIQFWTVVVMGRVCPVALGQVLGVPVFYL